ncbi:ABC transporter permease [Clostridium tagluense]|uniref:Diguanylate cyclase n=1 Tax=Clostridium tagluense TaxID=360422 RepID=A0A401UTT0_9CLOT|nr:ABC transporter permease [Clostridium tagluense]MCB2312555.1 ABC transporter permease [Clostridium tagluense]MCB2317178.1 ABC transporter permease [Clostridium tagluense]MCB2322042.1 ABC transporter permease [Clostridium tagluense]MCB2327127.1 ABC transporter permease [Clostridium tagluense]MCB2331897.1 ABC transporter permease [Clostridium tagluense]
MAQLSKEKFKIIGCENANAEEILRPSMTYWQDAWRRLKQNKVATASLIILILISLMTIFGQYINGFSFEVKNDNLVNIPPNSTHWFGTDNLGRDVFSRVWAGGRVSIIIGLIGAFIDTVVGGIYGGISGFYGGFIDDIMMRIVEILASIPYLVIVILVSLILHKGIWAIIIAMTITGWVQMARLVRGQLLQIKEQEYVLAAAALGANPSRIIAKHLLPNTLGIMIVAITFDIPAFIFGEAFLSYLGQGIQSPNTSWGALASAAQPSLMFYPYQLFFPSLFISLTMLSFTLLGDGLRDALDPRLRQ